MKRVRVKFCGITSSGDAEKAIEAGADSLGFVFFKDSPRYVTPEYAEAIIKTLPPFVTGVGVFVNEDLRFIEDCVEKCGLSAVQLHGDESPEYCLRFKNLNMKGVKLIKGIRVKDEESTRSIEDCNADAILLDSYKADMYGGTGKVFDPSLAMLAKEYDRRLIISGGLNPDNVREMIKEIRPYGVDVSSGIESSPGKKNVELMEEFIREVRITENQ
ncbi:MAG: phosphoribosylanthranilate isomerase [Candidatus Omnitrophica bacterium]|nr:phosphoribosylanthranilate isomerase [Candidatus Omnitrophota bacterium]MBU1932520.1 phosphoribosylanthranilate isomerase [Candidatus Omnitrophota bacterium]